MAVKLLSYITTLFALCQMFREAATQPHCSGKEESISDMMLWGHIYRKITGAPLGDVCLRECYRDVRCQSFNYVIWQDMCELSNRTKEARPEDFVPNSDRYYFKRDCGRVPLGSIPELPAESCKEIKASEGPQTVSGKYWFDSIIPGKTVRAHCDMNKEDVDECSASISVCDVNADCKNTRGSYRCSCKPGFTGDGKTCTDIDECKASISVCDVNANCKNTPSSYGCSCKPGFIGDGKTCIKGQLSCDKVLQSYSAASDGTYQLSIASSVISVYCDMTSAGRGWTMIARFSNNDTKNWMDDTGNWWYDKNDAFGETSDPSNNKDMISPAFWLVSGSEFKITRSDDPQHTPLLQTTGNCLGGQTFRSKVTSFGDFRNGKVWTSDQCLGSCTVQYSGGQYQTTDGFQQHACSGNIQGNQAIGFWCDWSTGDGAVLMIGGGGTSCSRADHGIGITEAGAASFVDGGTGELDFGGEANSVPTQSYSLNLWIR